MRKAYNIRLSVSLLVIFFLSASPLAAAIYYVDEAGGNDSNSGLSSSEAWRTVGKVNSSMSLFAPGDSILFRRGQNFRSQGELRITSGGASGNYVTYGAYGTGGKPILYRILCNSSNVGYVAVQDFEIYGVDTAIGFVGENSHHITISRCSIHDMSNNGIILSRINTYLIEDCVITDCNNGGIGILGSATYKITNGIIRNNRVGNIRENDAISLHKRDVTLDDCGPNHLLVNNVCYNCAENGIDITSGSYVTLRGNETYGNQEGGILVGAETLANVVIDRHYSHEDYIGIVFGGGKNVTLTSSIIYNASYHQIILFPQTSLTDFKAYHNTFVFGPSSTGLILDINSNVSNVAFKNNIFISTQYSNPKTYIRYMDGATPSSTASDFDYNTYWRRDDDSSTRWNAGGNISFSTWQSVWGQDIHGQWANPRLVSLSEKDYHLLSSSPCIDAGTSTTVRLDFEGTSIPQGAAPDVGAYEYKSDSPPPPPPPAELEARISASPISGDVPLTVDFSGSASGGTEPYRYRWTFGDGRSSTAQNPSHTYDQSGTFTARLTVTDGQSQTDTASVTITVNQVDPAVLRASMTAAPTSGEVPLTVNFAGSAAGGTTPYTYRWTFGDGQSSTAQRPSHTYSQTGTFTATLRVTDSSSQSASASRKIEVFAKSMNPLQITLNASPAAGFAPLTVNFSASATGGSPPYYYKWSFGDGTTTAQKDPAYLYNNAGNYNVTLSVTDSHANRADKYVTIKVSGKDSPADYRCTPDNLFFGAADGGTKTGDQSFFIQDQGLGELTWSIDPNRNWISCSPLSGTGRGKVRVSVDPSRLAPGDYSGRIAVAVPNSIHSPQYITVSLTVHSQDSPPIGYLDSPSDQAQTSGNIPVAGWALDDIEVTRVEIKREPHKNDIPEKIGDDGLVYLGQAALLDGARPDIQNIYSDYPLNHRAGWGYMLHTYQLPNKGTGSFTIYALAYDSGGQSSMLGTRTIINNNTNYSLPFGAIDAPLEAEKVSGRKYESLAWALTAPPKFIPYDGGTLWVWMDGARQGHPEYGLYRQDIAARFSECSNAQGAGARFVFDSTGFTDGVHSIIWSASDDSGETAAIDTSYFIIQNQGQEQSPPGYLESKSLYQEDTDGSLNLEVLELRQGYNLYRIKDIQTQRDGTVVIETEEMEPIKIEFKTNSESALFFYGWGEHEWESLPMDSTLKPRGGLFYWIPTPGFLGTYTFHFSFTDGFFISHPLRVKVNVVEKIYDNDKKKQSNIER